MLKPGRYDIIIYKGVTFDLPLTWIDGSNNIFDLTTCTAKMQIRSSVLSPTAIFSLSSLGGSIILTSGDPNIVINIDATDTANISLPLECAESAVYDLEIMEPSGTVLLLLRGKVKILTTVTR